MNQGNRLMFAPFTFESSPLTWLKVNDQGIVMRLKKADASLIQTLTNLGILPGISISMEQRSPTVVIKIGEKLTEISPEIAGLIHVKLDRS